MKAKSMHPHTAVMAVRRVIGDPTDKCYPAAEAVYHLTGKFLVPCHMPNEGGGTRKKHWYLRFPFVDIVIDPTVHQFTHAPTYKDGKGCGFLTKNPSKRAQAIIDKVREL